MLYFRTMDVNVLAVFWVTQTFLEDMRELGKYLLLGKYPLLGKYLLLGK